MAKGRRTDTDIVREVHRLALSGYRPAEIHRRIERQWGRTEAPTLRTVENIAREVTPKDPSATWTVVEADADTIATVLPSLAEVIRRSEGRIRRLTVREAGWVHRLRSAIPDLPAWEAYRLARLYLTNSEQGEPTASLDIFLAYAPWRDKGEAYFAAFESRWIDTWHGSEYQPDDVAQRLKRMAASGQKDGGQ